jgi:metal-responsive CopG/Arc/MetJ family transcriptional regulator
MKRTVVWLTDQQIKELAHMSKGSLAPISALVREAVKDFLRRKRNRPGRKAAKR